MNTNEKTPAKEQSEETEESSEDRAATWNTSSDAESNQPVDLPDFLAKTIVMTGVKINYLHICKTKLWLFSHNITMEKEHQNVAIGKFLHRHHYKRDSKELQVDGIAIDFIRKKDLIEVHEVKKTKSMKNAHLAQMKYYLFVLKKYGINAVGVMNYPKIRRTERVSLTLEDAAKLAQEEKEIEGLVLGTMPKPERKRICSKCAYLEYCFSGEPEPEKVKQ